jgi:aconitate decarboxylase
VLGIEIQGRLRAAAGALESHELRFHPPGFVGPIGAAVAAGHLLDFDAGQFANAIGIAGSRCGGLFINLGRMTKATHCAYAAALGLEAALLTRRGFTGCPRCSIRHRKTTPRRSSLAASIRGGRIVQPGRPRLYR